MKVPNAFLFGLITIILSAGCGSPGSENLLENGRWIDLTHTYNEDAIFWPTAREFDLDTVSHGHTDAGYFYAAFNFNMAEHGGTHLDAPIHFAEGKWASHEIPVEKFSGKGIVVDVSEKALENRDYQVSRKDFETWEAANGRIPDGAIVLVNTGSAHFWPDKERYMGTAERGQDAIPNLHFPGLAPDAARWLVEHRNIKAFGLDTPSIDYGQSKDFMSHRILYEENIMGIENVMNLDKLPAKGFYLFAFPMKIEGGSGGPLRITALVP